MYTIGEFSAITHITRKALRWYDETGVLPPASTDPESGYRYYGRSQIDTARLITRLKSYGFRLETIRTLLQDPDTDWKAVLERQQRLLQEQNDQLSLTIADLSQHLNDLERTHNIMTYQKQYAVRLQEQPALPVMTCRETTDVSQIGRLFSRLFETLGQHHIRPGKLAGLRYFDPEFDPEQADMEAFIDVAPESADSVIPACLAAAVTHKGAYSNLGDAYAALSQWIAENGYEICQPPYEIYRIDGHSGAPVSDWETDIYFPVRKKETI